MKNFNYEQATEKKENKGEEDEKKMKNFPIIENFLENLIYQLAISFRQTLEILSNLNLPILLKFF